MAFEGLSSRLQDITRKIKGEARITESNMKDMLREVKLALLEADVNYKIVKEFIASVQEKALGQDVMKSLKPGEQVVKIVRDELTELLGGTDSKINISPNPPTVIMLVGLQGAGKTTMAGKLANYLRKQGKKPLMVACDVYRPAAIKQLQVVGAQLNIPVYAEEGCEDVVAIAKRAMNAAMSKLNDVVIIDTAGRLQIDEALMQELQDVKKAVRPHEILLVVDSMTGQEAVNVADSFNSKVGIDGVVLTKLDGDTRGGAALSVKKVTGKPIKFIGVGEKLNELEEFHPDRMASRILGMGDVLSIVEKAEQALDIEEAEKRGIANKETVMKKSKWFMIPFCVIIFVALILIISIWNHVTDFKTAYFQSFLFLVIMNWFDGIVIDRLWVGHSKIWHIEGMEDVSYVKSWKTVLIKRGAATVVYMLVALVVAGIVVLISKI